MIMASLITYATNIPEVTYFAAMLFDPFDPEASMSCFTAMQHVCNGQSSERRQQLVEQGDQQLDRFDWETIVAKLIDVYRQVACA